MVKLADTLVGVQTYDLQGDLVISTPKAKTGEQN